MAHRADTQAAPRPSTRLIPGVGTVMVMALLVGHRSAQVDERSVSAPVLAGSNATDTSFQRRVAVQLAKASTIGLPVRSDARPSASPSIAARP